MTRKLTYLLLLALISTSLYAQKKVLEQTDFDLWNVIKDESISGNGQFVCYSLEKGEKDHYLQLSDAQGNKLFSYDRGRRGQFSKDATFLVFTIKPWQDSLTVLKQRKTDKDKMPKDILAIYDLMQRTLTKIAPVKSYKIAEDWSGYSAYQLDEIKEEKISSTMRDTSLHSASEKANEPKPKKPGKDNGYHLIIRELATGYQDTIRYVLDYQFAKKEAVISYTSSGDTLNARQYLVGSFNMSINNLALAAALGSIPFDL